MIDDFWSASGADSESFAVCKFYFGNSFKQDGLAGATFDYSLSNPPLGVEWKKVQKGIRCEDEKFGMVRRFARACCASTPLTPTRRARSKPARPRPSRPCP